MQACVRTCLYSIMGIDSAQPLPKPLERSAGYWTMVTLDKGPEAEEVKVLRPDWNGTWHDNKVVWLMGVRRRIQRFGTQYSDALTAEHLASIPEERISKAIERVFASMVERYKLENTREGKTKRKQRNDGNKIRNRKNSVSTSRS